MSSSVNLSHFLPALGLLLVSGYVDANERPDVVLVNCDDLGWGDLGCYGSNKIRTPHLDRMAGEGVRMTSFYVAAPICTASRAALMTGCYPRRVGLHRGVLRPNAVRGLASEEYTLAELFRDAGYDTMAIGKWHLGFIEPFRPTDQGFDDYVGVYHNLDAWETVYFAGRRVPWIEGEKPGEPVDNREVTRRYTQAAIDRLNDQSDRPLMIYLAHAFPHIPLGVAPEFLGRSRGGLYGDAIAEIDHETGRLLTAALARRERTGRPVLVLFTSDNGPSPVSSGSSGPFRGTKHTSWEGGLRVPLILWGPGLIPSGVVSQEFVASIDLLPSFAGLLGIGIPGSKTIDGLDLGNAFFRGDTQSLRRELLFHDGGGNLQGIRQNGWKLRVVNGRTSLFHLVSDPGESDDVSKRYPNKVTELQERMKTLGDSLEESSRSVGTRSDLPSAKTLPPVYDHVMQSLDSAAIEHAENAAQHGINVAAYIERPGDTDEQTRRRLAESGIPLRGKAK